MKPTYRAVSLGVERWMRGLGDWDTERVRGAGGLDMGSTVWRRVGVLLGSLGGASVVSRVKRFL
jgi:hypothetical protein